MTQTKRTNRTALLAATLAGALLSLPQISMAAASGARSFAADDSGAASDVQPDLASDLRTCRNNGVTHDLIITLVRLSTLEEAAHSVGAEF